MIRIDKPAQAPPVLRERGEAAPQALRAAYDAAPDDYRSGAAKLPINAGLCGHPSVVEALTVA